MAILNSRFAPVPYVKQTVTGGLWDSVKKRFTKTDIPNRILKNGKKIRSVGCGQCCMSMALYPFVGWIDPEKLDDRISASGGSYHDIGMYEAKKRDIEAEYTTSMTKVKEALRNGWPVLCIQGKGIFTTSGHYILLMGMVGNKIAVHDPVSYYRTYTTNSRLYNPSDIDDTAKKSDGKAYTIFKRDTYTVKVKTRLNIWADTAKSESFGYLKDGQAVKVIDFNRITRNGCEFVKVSKTSGVTLPNGKKQTKKIVGYVDWAYLS